MLPELPRRQPPHGESIACDVSSVTSGERIIVGSWPFPALLWEGVRHVTSGCLGHDRESPPFHMVNGPGGYPIISVAKTAVAGIVDRLVWLA